MRLLPKVNWTGKRVSEAREWLNALTGIGVLILAVITLWTAARVSDVEDFLRSEISRRNSDLNAISARSIEIERTADERERQLRSLDAATRDSVAASLLAHSQLAQSQAQLGQIRTAAFGAELRLRDAQLAQSKLQGQYETQELGFDLLRRQQTYEAMAIALTFGLYLDEDKREISGEDALTVLGRTVPEEGRGALLPYYMQVKQAVPSLCPTLAQYYFVVPPILPRPDAGALAGVWADNPGPKQSEIYREADKTFSGDLEEYLNSMSSAYEARRKATETVLNESTRCVCKALVTAQLGRDKICPDAKS